jgi:hypothetical protein
MYFKKILKVNSKTWHSGREIMAKESDDVARSTCRIGTNSNPVEMPLRHEALPSLDLYF